MTASAPEQTLVIRIATSEDYDVAGRVTEEAYSSSYSGLSAAYLQSLRDVAVRVERGDVWVAEDGTGAIVGTVWVPRPGETLSELAQEGELDFRQLAVAPSARGQGVGALLTRFVVELARQRGLQRVVMSSGPRMTGAHRLYQRLGFVRLTDRETRVVEGGTLLAFGLDVATTAPAHEGARP